jgi:hypothetical protein
VFVLADISEVPGVVSPVMTGMLGSRFCIPDQGFISETEMEKLKISLC